MIRATATISTVIWPRWANAERPVLRSAAKPTDVAELVEGSDKSVVSRTVKGSSLPNSHSAACGLASHVESPVESRLIQVVDLLSQDVRRAVAR